MGKMKDTMNNTLVSNSGVLRFLIENFDEELKLVDVTTEVFENVPHEIDDMDYSYFKLQDVSDYLNEKYSVRYKNDAIVSPVIYVWEENALCGIVYCYGNHLNGKWEVRGTLRGYA